MMIGNFLSQAGLYLVKPDGNPEIVANWDQIVKASIESSHWHDIAGTVKDQVALARMFQESLAYHNITKMTPEPELLLKITSVGISKISQTPPS
mgnify:CR=1 FL=1